MSHQNTKSNKEPSSVSDYSAALHSYHLFLSVQPLPSYEFGMAITKADIKKKRDSVEAEVGKTAADAAASPTQTAVKEAIPHLLPLILENSKTATKTQDIPRSLSVLPPIQGHINSQGYFYAWDTAFQKTITRPRLVVPGRSINVQIEPALTTQHVYNVLDWCQKDTSDDPVDYPYSWEIKAWPPNMQEKLLWARKQDGPCLHPNCGQKPLNYGASRHCRCNVADWRLDRYEKYGSKIFIKWIDDKLGYGAFTSIAIAKDEVLGDYLGELIPKKLWREGERDDTYTMGIYADTEDNTEYEVLGFIDSQYHGNWTRFVNHHCTDFNVEVSPPKRLGKTRVSALVALRDIEAGEQISFDYGENFFAHNFDEQGQRIVVRTCACGSSGCRY